ncbi:MAG: pyruvate kinase [Methylococcaceae bacterium]|nr:pyruvate kinase [Methylococcaceae bacterium]
MPKEVSKKRFEKDAYTEILTHLLADVIDVREKVAVNAESRLELYKEHYRSGVFTKSATNLAQYLALRQFDLRHLQTRLSQAGLSSLGRAEASVMSTLDSVIYLLKRATDKESIPVGKNPSEYGFNRGQQLLEQHTIELFGAYYENSKAHVMVTLATDAAWDYQHIHSLLTKGMTCARINCAHDDTVIWQAMICNIRRAEVETGRPCKIMMDLAGHKIRTGLIEPGPAVHHIKTKKDNYGNVISPGYVLLCAEKKMDRSDKYELETLFQIPVSTKLLTQLKPGVYLRFTDARGKQRKFLVEKSVDKQQWLVSCERNSYLSSGCELELFTAEPEADEKSEACYHLGEFEGAPLSIRVFKDEALLLTDYSINGRPSEYDADGVQIRPAQISCTLSSAIDKVKIGQPVWIDDGKLGSVVEKIDDDGVLLRVTRAGTKGVNIKSDKGINFPETQLGLPSLSEKDLTDLDFVCAHADLVGFSFVESLENMQYLIEQLAQRNATDLPIIAKIETNLAVKNLPEIILGTLGKHSLGIMIARGDLSVELGSARLAEVQEELLWLCEAAHVPVIWATQVLESIAKKGTRSRAEFTDAAMAVRAECVMLNKGPYIIDALEALINVMIRMQEHQHKKFPRLRALHW